MLYCTEYTNITSHYITPYLFYDDGEGGNHLGVAVGTGGLVVGLVAAPVGHYLLIVEQNPGAK